MLKSCCWFKLKYLQKSTSHLLVGCPASVPARPGPNLSSRTELTISTSTAIQRSACSSKHSRPTAGWLEAQRLLLLLQSVHEQYLQFVLVLIELWAEINGAQDIPCMAIIVLNTIIYFATQIWRFAAALDTFGKDPFARRRWFAGLGRAARIVARARSTHLDSRERM